MRILVATDLSARSDRAMARGFTLARELQAELRIVHVVDADLPADLVSHAMAWARNALCREITRHASSTGVKASIEVCAGHPKSDIVARSGPGQTDLIVLGVHNRAASGGGGFAETTAGRILKSTLSPLLLVRGAATEPYRQIVVGVDFSPFSRAAIRQSRRIAPTTTFHLVHAYQVPFKALLGSEHFASDVAYAQRLEFEAFLTDEMEALGRRANDFGITPGRLDKVMREGEPAQVLRAECRRADAELLVIGTHGRSGVSRAIWGSIATNLLDDPPCDVLVVRPY